MGKSNYFFLNMAARDDDSDSSDVSGAEADNFLNEGEVAASGMSNDQCQAAQVGQSSWVMWKKGLNTPADGNPTILDNKKKFEKSYDRAAKKADKNAKKNNIEYTKVWICLKTARTFYLPQEQADMEAWEKGDIDNPKSALYWMCQWIQPPPKTNSLLDNFDNVDEDDDSDS